MGAYAPGQIKKFYYVPESTYGTTPTSALTWGGEPLSVKMSPLTDLNNIFTILPGSRSFGTKSRDVAKVGFNLRAFARKVSGGYNWRNLWAAYAYGSTSGLADSLGSFTAQVGKTVGATHKYNFYNGCKIDRLSLVGESPGKEIVFDADILAQWITPSTSKVITGLQGLTVGADPSDITSAVITWDTNPQINLGSGLADFKPDNWNLTVTNGLDRAGGIRVGADTNKYPVVDALNEGPRLITFEATMKHGDETYQNAKIADTLITALTVKLDTYTITLANGYFEANDLVEFKSEDLMTETFKIRFKSLSIA